MARRLYRYLAFLALLNVFCFLIISCSPWRFKEAKEYYQYIEDSKNGLNITTKFEEFVLKAKYIPNELRVLQDIGGGEVTSSMADSLLRYYSNSILFHFTITPTQFCRVRDLRYYGVDVAENYNQHLKYLNFDMAQHFNLQVGDNSYQAQLCVLEQDYGKSGGLKFILLFIPEKEIAKNIDFLKSDISLYFNDPFFNTSETQFSFKSTSIKNIPKLDI